MLSRQAIFLLAATMFGSVAQAEPGGSVPNFNVKAKSGALAVVPEALIFSYLGAECWLLARGPSSGSQCGPGAGFNEAVGGYQTDTTGSGRDA